MTLSIDGQFDREAYNSKRRKSSLSGIWLDDENFRFCRPESF